MKQLSLVTVLFLTATTAAAEIIDFGGYGDRFKGGGDKIPPQCQVDFPDAASEPFWIKWNCEDDNAAKEELRTEFWIYRKGADIGELTGNFLGFPGAVFIDAEKLGAESFTAGLPFQFKLVIRDRAGNATISAPFTVVEGSNDTTTDNVTCAITLTQEAIASSGDVTGQPATTVVVSDAVVDTTVNETSLTIATKTAETASPCEIDAVCAEDSKITFASSLTLTDSTAAGTLTVSPGDVTLEVTGPATVTGNSIDSLTLTGTGTIDGNAASVSVDCN